MNVWDEKETLIKMEIYRDKVRSSGKRLTFDCMNLHCRGERVFCIEGHLLGQAKDGSLALVTVLRGVTSGTCLSCKEFTTDKED